MYIVKITNNTPLCKMVNFSRSVLKIYTGQKKFTRAAPVAPVTNIRYALVFPKFGPAPSSFLFAPQDAHCSTLLCNQTRQNSPPPAVD